MMNGLRGDLSGCLFYLSPGGGDTASDNAGINRTGHGLNQLLTLLQEIVLPVATQNQWLLNPAPAQAGGDGFQCAPGAGAIVTGADYGGTGFALGVLQTGVVNPVKIILQGAAHIAEVFRRQQHNG